jgi:hypothetical protein
MNDEEVEALYDEMCSRFMVEDIRRSIHDAKANYLVALGLFSYLEVLGGLLSGDGAMRDKATDNFREVIKHLPADYQKLDQALVVKGADGKEHKGIYGVFRCGLVHEYAPKGPVIVFNNPGAAAVSGRLGIEIKNENGVTKLVVNNNELFRDFEDLVNHIRQMVARRDAIYFGRIKTVFERMEAYRVET